MTSGQQDRTAAGWLVLLALPVLCCIGHAVLLAVGVGSLTAFAGAVLDESLLAVVGVAVVAAAAAAVLVRRRRR